MRPPLTRHRLNREVRLLDPTEPDAALKALMTVPPDLADRVDAARDLDENAPTPQTPRMRRRLTEEAERIPISDRMSRLLQHGDTNGEYVSNSEVVHAITTEAVRCGWTLDEVFDVLADPENEGGRRLRDETDRYGEDRAREWLEHGFHKAEEYLDLVRAVSADRLTYWSRYATRGLEGLTATSDRAVLQALLDVSRRAGRLEINASHRELAEMTGLARGTARTALERLEARGLFQVVDRRKSPTESLTYELLPKALDALADSTFDPPSAHPQYPAVSLSVDNALGHDLWRNKSGLGKGTGLTWLALTNRPKSIAMLAQERGVGRDTIRRHLRVLQHHGLARVTPNGWLPRNVQSASLDSLAKTIGVLGRGEAQKQIHASERVAFTIRQRQIK